MNSSATYKKRIVLITSRFPYPLEKGDKLRAYYQIRELSKQFDVYLIALSEKNIVPIHQNKIEDLCEKVFCFKLHPVLKWINGSLQFFGSKPYQVGYFYQGHIKREVEKCIEEIQPDHIICQLIRTTEYAKNYHACTKTLDYMDALSKGMERRYTAAPFYKKWLFKQESKRLLNYENRVFDYFENHCIIAKEDRNFIFHKDKDRIKIIPNGVGEHFFQSPNISPVYDIVFIGNMSYAPNIKAAQYIVNKILPLLPKKTKVLLAGAEPVSEVKQLKNPQVTISGWVDDIREAYASGKVFIAPMFIGTGLQNKLLEAMAIGIPCITSPLANKALNAKIDEEILIAENPKEFAEHFNRLINQENNYHQFAQSGRKFVKDNYNWEHVTQQLIEGIKF